MSSKTAGADNESTIGSTPAAIPTTISGSLHISTPRSAPPNRPSLLSYPSDLSSRTTSSSLRSVHSIPEEGAERSKPSQRIKSTSRPTSAGSRAGETSLRIRTGRLRQEMLGEGYELGMMGSGQKGTEGATLFATVSTSPDSKEDLVMAKWRKWAVEQPSTPISMADISSLRSRKASSHTPSTGRSPNTTHTGSSSSLPSTRLPTALPLTGLDRTWRSSDTPSVAAESQSRTGSNSGSRMFDTGEIFMTDSMRALQDVELAVDEEVMAQSVAQSRQESRPLSTQPRLSPAENPFADIASRLSSRRIRPIVLELIHALGHYIFMLWSIEHPGAPCPWVTPAHQSTSTLLRRWHSWVITAVAEGQAQGHVPPAPSRSTLTFWRAEVEYGLRDVNEAVGRWKKQGMVFARGLESGKYGEVEDGNVLNKDEKQAGGNIVRLLNDLEEVIWGDAAPRISDLSFVLPAGFDPYAEPTADDFIAQPPAGASTILGGTYGPPAAYRSDSLSPRAAHRADLEEVLSIPDAVSPRAPIDETAPAASRGYARPIRAPDAVGTSGPEPSLYTNQGVAQVWAQRARASVSAQGGAHGAHGGRGNGLESAVMTLGEVGRMRHEEWLASQATGRT